MYSLEELSPYFLNPYLNEGKIIKGLHRIQSSFTTNLDQRDEYVIDRDLVSCYSSFYLPTNMVKLNWGLSNLDSVLIDQLKESVLIDYGCGPGTFTLAWLNYFGDGEVYCVDLSSLMLDQAEKFGKAFFPNAQISYSQENPSIEKQKVLLFGHSMNEMSLMEIESLIEKTDPEHIIMIEPGTYSVFQLLKELRGKLIGKYNLHYPCIDHSPCPMIDKDWCHQVIRTTHDPSIERLSQKAKIDRRTMPLCFHVYSKSKPVRLTTARTVQFLRETKFSFDYKVCMGDKLVEIQILKKKLSKSQKKNIEKHQIGESLSFSIDKEINSHQLRVSLDS